MAAKKKTTDKKPEKKTEAKKKSDSSKSAFSKMSKSDKLETVFRVQGARQSDARKKPDFDKTVNDIAGKQGANQREPGGNIHVGKGTARASNSRSAKNAEEKQMKEIRSNEIRRSEKRMAEKNRTNAKRKDKK